MGCKNKNYDCAGSQKPHLAKEKYFFIDILNDQEPLINFPNEKGHL